MHSGNLIKQVNLIISIFILLFIIIIGVFFDIIGVAVTSSRSTFHAMAADKVREAGSGQTR